MRARAAVVASAIGRSLQIAYRTRARAGVKRRPPLKFRIVRKVSAVTDAKSAPKATPEQMANAIRVLAMDGVEKAKSGHPGMPMGMADVATVLFSKFLKFDASRPDWADRDRFILSAGHGSMLIYALLHLTGYKAATKQELSNFRQWGSKTAGHPEYGHMPGVEVTTGPLGQGLATSVGFAPGRAASGRQIRRRPGRSPHLGHRRRRLPDGRRVSGSHRPGRPL